LCGSCLSLIEKILFLILVCAVNFFAEIHFPFLPFLLPSKPSVISSKAPLGFFRFHSTSCIVDLASWILVHAQFYLSTHGHNISHHFLPGLKVFGLVFCSREGRARQGFCPIRYHAEDFFGGSGFRSLPLTFLSCSCFLWPDSFLSAALGSLCCFSLWSLSKSSNASYFWFSLLWRLSLLSAAGLIAVPLAADFFTRACCSIRSLPPPL
jgi:hypothetical protein